MLCSTYCLLAGFGYASAQLQNRTFSPLSTSIQVSTSQSITSASQTAEQSDTGRDSSSSPFPQAATATPISNVTRNESFVVQSAWECMLALSQWSNAGTYVAADYTTRTDRTSLSTYTTFYSSIKTLCDGVPRVVYTGNRTWDVITSTISLDPPELYSWRLSSFEQPPQPCTVSSDVYSTYCSQLADIYSTSRSMALDDSNPDAFNVEYVWPSLCPTTMSQYPTTSYCYIAPQSAQMFYWYTPRPSNFCSNETMIATANSSMTGPSTVDYSGTILTSPTVYISYHNLTYAYSSGLFSTRLITDTFIPYHPDEISMVCGYRNIEGTMAINYADLVSPVPWSSYGCQPRCFARFDTRCQPVDEVLYPFNPVLDVPPRMSKVLSDLGNPHPEECKFAPSGVGAGGWFDPPRVLRPAEHLLEPKPTTAQSLTLVDPISREPPSPAPTLAAPPQKTADPLGGDDFPPARPPSPSSTVPEPGPSLSFSTAKPIATPPAVGQIGPDTPPLGHDSQVGAGQGNDPPDSPSPGTPSPGDDPDEVPSQDNGLSRRPSSGNDPTNSLAQVSSPSTGGIDSKPDPKLAVSGSVVVIGRSTMTAGAAPVTVAGHIIFIPQPQITQSAGSILVAKPVVVVDSITIPLGDLEQVMATAMPELRVAGVQVITQSLLSGTLSSARLVPAMVIAGTKTLLSGDGPITIGGRVLSVASQLNGDGSADGFVIFDGTTVAMKSFEDYVKTAIPNLRDPGIVATTVVVPSSRTSGTNAVVQDIAGWIMSGLAGQPPYNGVATQSGDKGGQGQDRTVEGFKGGASRLGKIKIEMWCLMVLCLGLVNLVI